MEILVTGGAGFIGSNFVHFLLENTDAEVKTLDALTYAADGSNLDGVMEHPRHEFVEGDIRDTALVEDVLETSDVVVNFAAETHVDRSIANSEPFVSTNIQGTRTLLDGAKSAEIDRFVQLSTDEVYGEILSGKFTEEDPLNPRNPYAATKASADHLVKSYAATHDLSVNIIRPSNNFGPRQHPEKLIPKFITRSASGEQLPLYGDGSNVREWTYVKDTCRAIGLVISDAPPGEIYNVGSGSEFENFEVCKRILDAVDASEDLIEFVDDRPGHDQRYALETAKIESLGWSPKYSFDDALTETKIFYV